MHEQCTSQEIHKLIVSWVVLQTQWMRISVKRVVISAEQHYYHFQLQVNRHLVALKGKSVKGQRVSPLLFTHVGDQNGRNTDLISCCPDVIRSLFPPAEAGELG